MWSVIPPGPGASSRRSARRVARAAGLVAAAGLVLGGCSAAAGSKAPNWKPKPSFSGEGYNPGNRQPIAPTDPNRPPQPTPSPSATNGKKGDGAVVATRLDAPTALTILPDGSALVGERTTGRIVRVQPQPGQPVQTVRTLTGLSTAGGGGLLDLAISPNYAEDNLLFAYITTPADDRVVAFTLKGPVTTVIGGIPRGTSNNTGRITFDAKGDLLVGTSDAGRPAAAADPRSLAGKVLRISDIGKPAHNNPIPGSPVYASGFRRTDGLCIDPQTGTQFQVGYRPDERADPVFQVLGGRSYGWPSASRSTQGPVATLPETSRDPGDCAVANGVLYTTSLDGQALLGSQIKPSGPGTITLGRPNVSLRNRYGRLLTVVAAPDGSLWLTTSNKDGHGKPVPSDERVLHIVPSGGGGGSTV